jgi:hypothetical protein
MRTLKVLVAAGGLVALAGAAQATLVDRGGGMIYDATRNITWLADMNYAFTSGYTATPRDGVFADGRMNWDAATTWVSNLVYGGFSDWRLPTLNTFSDTTCSDTYGSGMFTQYYGTGCTGGELSGLFVTDLGNKANESVLNQVGDTADQKDSLALFSNVKAYYYWSGTQASFALASDYAWDFNSFGGIQDLVGKNPEFYAVAVRPGDVTNSVPPGDGPPSVPEPQTLALTLLALGAMVVARRRRPA